MLLLQPFVGDSVTKNVVQNVVEAVNEDTLFILNR